jgi:uncharacterized cupin superfamily protein
MNFAGPILAILALVTWQAPSNGLETPTKGASFIVVNSKVPLNSFRPLSELAIPGRPSIVMSSNEFYSNDLRVGVFEGRPGIAKVTNWPHDEFITLILGDVVITDAAGKRQSFHSGDSFVLPRGFNGTYEAKTNMREIYVFGPEHK